MTHDPWPSSDAMPGPLPRIEDLPIAEQGYEQEAVRQAFDGFYRHAAQLDASLRALEAVEIFRRDADALRNDLRALRSFGLGGSFEATWSTARYESQRLGIPAVVLRLVAEAALIVSVAVIAGVAHLRTVAIVALMAAAFLIVAVSEWLAGRARFVPPAVAFIPPTSEGEPAPYVEAPATPAWGIGAEPDEDTEPESLAIVESAAVDPWEEGVEPIDVGVDVGVDADAEPERAGLFRRRRRR
jgi:hypothetical protein